MELQSIALPTELPSQILREQDLNLRPSGYEPDETRFPCLRLAREAMRAGGGAPCVLNAANEVSVQNFLDGRVGFTDICLSFPKC